VILQRLVSPELPHQHLLSHGGCIDRFVPSAWGAALAGLTGGDLVAIAAVAAPLI
jgi:hypothetical protein